MEKRVRGILTNSQDYQETFPIGSGNFYLDKIIHSDTRPLLCKCGCGQLITDWKANLIRSGTFHPSDKYRNSCWSRIQQEKRDRISSRYALKINRGFDRPYFKQNTA